MNTAASWRQHYGLSDLTIMRRQLYRQNTGCWLWLYKHEVVISSCSVLMEGALQAVSTWWIIQWTESLRFCPNDYTCGISNSSSVYLCDIFPLIMENVQVPVKSASKWRIFHDTIEHTLSMRSACCSCNYMVTQAWFVYFYIKNKYSR